VPSKAGKAGGPGRAGRAGLLLFAALAFLALVTSCTEGTPSGPSIPAPVIVCPLNQSAEAPTGAVSVIYPKPAVSEGTAPVTTTCAPPSGSIFPIGSTNVTCTARDSSERSASCTFRVNVTRPSQLSATRFVAFGDSITAGVLATSCPAGGGVNCSVSTTTTMSAAQRRFELQKIFANLEESPAAYPHVLQALLAGRYVSQSITIANEGRPGEFVADGKVRLPGTLGGAPQVLLLLEGANDMNQGRPPLDAIVNDLGAMVREGRNRGMTVLVATLLPQRQTACRGYDFCDGVNDTALLNARIRTMVAAQGATLVDLYPAFEGQTSTLLGLDGLHPNEAGYQKMADLFLQTIQQTLEVR